MKFQETLSSIKVSPKNLLFVMILSILVIGGTVMTGIPFESVIEVLTICI